MKTVLITGAAGNIGSQLRREFAGRYKLRLSDKRLIRPTAGETCVQADIGDMAEALAISDGIACERTLAMRSPTSTAEDRGWPVEKD